MFPPLKTDSLAVYGGIALILYDLMTKIEKNKSEYEEN
jgi:hypothetical protein